MSDQIKKVNIMPRPEAWDHVRQPLTDDVDEQHPLEAELFTSFRSGYCYLGMERYAALQRDYNVNIHVRFVRPILMRDPEFFYKASDYRYLYDPMDMGRQANCLGLPWRGAAGHPDICKTAGNIVTPAPKEEQGLFYRVYSISALIQTEHPDKIMSWAQIMFRNLYVVDDWDKLIPSVLTELGLEVSAVEKKAKENEDKYMAIIEQNEKDGHATGHGGVPNAAFRGEPFWGHDRIDTFIWRLKQNGLTKRWAEVVK
jgi:2-hydroxychromene-2-carboxylate isomerase